VVMISCLADELISTVQSLHCDFLPRPRALGSAKARGPLTGSNLIRCRANMSTDKVHVITGLQSANFNP
jgi:hypothetical protein